MKTRNNVRTHAHLDDEADLLMEDFDRVEELARVQRIQRRDRLRRAEDQDLAS